MKTVLVVVVKVTLYFYSCHYCVSILDTTRILVNGGMVRLPFFVMMMRLFSLLISLRRILRNPLMPLKNASHGMSRMLFIFVVIILHCSRSSFCGHATTDCGAIVCSSRSIVP